MQLFSSTTAFALWLGIRWAAGGISHEPCQANPASDESCFKIHGCASWSNGTGPWIRIVGSKRHVALIYDDRKFPTFSRYLESDASVYGDFEICPLQKDRPGIMREVCLQSVSNLVVEQFGENGARSVFRVKKCPECLSTVEQK